MLVLSRQRDETIMIGDDIEITVVDIRGDKIRLGIEAPLDVAVHRKEVYEAIRRENEQAAQLDHAELKSFRIDPDNIEKSSKKMKGRGQTRGDKILRSNKTGKRSGGRAGGGAGSRSRRTRTA